MLRVTRPFGSALSAVCVALALCSLSCTSTVVDVYVSTDADGTRKLQKDDALQFITLEADVRAIYCIAEISNGREDATIIGVMHQQSVTNADGSASVDRDIVVASLSELAPVGAQQRVALALLPRNAAGEVDDQVPLSGGIYRCEFALRTTPVPEGTAPKPDGEVQFEVKRTSCPPSQIVPGSDCSIYGEGKECKADGERTVKPETSPICVCSANAWSCP